MTILSDDNGSLPLPNEIDKQTYTTAYFRAIEALGNGEELSKDPMLNNIFNKVCREAMVCKLETGLDVVNYPQMGVDMVSQFLKPIQDYTQQSNRPYRIDKKYAVLPPLVNINTVFKTFTETHDKVPKLKVCITGPIELYHNTEIGQFVSEDILMNLAESVQQFVKNACNSLKDGEIGVISIDEPSLGFRDLGKWDEDILIRALQKAVESNNGITTQIHLHSLNARHIPLQVEGINILTCEYAGNSTHLEGVEREEFEDYDKFLRVGIARTDIDAINLELHEKGIENGFNRIKQRELPASTIVEDQSIMIKRLKAVYERFGDQIVYSGPDCGFGYWPTQEAALKQIANSVKAIKEFQKLGHH